jgi:hypothetical protein
MANSLRVVGWAQEEIRARAEKRKQDTIAKIKELAGAVGVSVIIDGQRGRSATGLAKTKALKPERKVGDGRRKLIERYSSGAMRPTEILLAAAFSEEALN